MSCSASLASRLLFMLPAGHSSANTRPCPKVFGPRIPTALGTNSIRQAATVVSDDSLGAIGAPRCVQLVSSRTCTSMYMSTSYTTVIVYRDKSSSLEDRFMISRRSSIHSTPGRGALL
ncbi:hypothetical protein B0H67DRAFT_23949 [Lasiosphaeris hirsuta]|uniref:Secreted protein n=1 Tax=Lasiosphaeris hirsuta TaxID=260670 RepID=A0AA40B9G1_9PEZI|nr:hypothetical protein B0H67DRAFT_23949 [Lasiosphaeris hirsuta]